MQATVRLENLVSESKLIAVIGTGVSLALTEGTFPALSWKGLIRHGFAYSVQKARLTELQSESWKNHIESDDLDELLSAAEFMGRKLEAPGGDVYARWLENAFRYVTPVDNDMAKAIIAIDAAGVPICTLNYDTLLERVTGLDSINFTQTSKVTAWMRREKKGILHLHGSWDAPSTCILGIRDYDRILKDEVRDLIQRSLASLNHLLFLGCGDTFADPNFSTLVMWLRRRLSSAAPQHTALVTADQMSTRNADPSWQGFVEPMSYGKDRSKLAPFLISHFRPVTSGRESTSIRTAAVDRSQVLADYRQFLLRDCGQMAIEGVRADMDIGQRKFDLERLFVPLKILPLPPDFSASDPERVRKLTEWQEKNKDHIRFGQVFAKCRHIALLALPGGGKTMLLKRLAAAYADPTRRGGSEDGLPDIDLMPVLIRCREWREHIQRPILTLLQSIPEITGQPPLEGLSDALMPLLKEGRVLLLVDGLDEIHNDAQRTTFVQHLEAFLGQYKLIHFVVTSREAGFGLVAPTLARFCERWRVAPLQEDAVIALCTQWQTLMTGGSANAVKEGQELARLILRNDSLRLLAENPLLLTMLLVVKHGEGRLPPDRVSLYGRAVEVLLDTWNIQGHEPLNSREAIPQVAFVAFRLMITGKQTATEKELLALLEEAREKIPRIRRYATDTSEKFLQRVELRSSLIIEAGEQMEGGRAVSFYQFRHLTFQEYLAAVAAVEGHYSEYKKDDTVLTPLKNFLTAAEWKEVIPMSAVLAKKQAEPLMSALVTKAITLREEAVNGEKIKDGGKIWPNFQLPAVVSRLVQCLAEEAEASSEVLTSALQIIAFFARGCSSSDNWQALARGPYGEELLHQTWLLYSAFDLPSECRLILTFSTLAYIRQPEDYWWGGTAQAEILETLGKGSATREQIARAMVTSARILQQYKPGRGIFVFGDDRDRPIEGFSSAILPVIERYILSDDSAIYNSATLAWAFYFDKRQRGQEIAVPAGAPPVHVLDRVLLHWLGQVTKERDSLQSFAFSTQCGLRRDSWSPILTEAQRKIVRQAGAGPTYDKVASLVIAFHAKDVWNEEELATELSKLVGSSSPSVVPGLQSRILPMLQQMGEIGRKHIATKEKSRKKGVRRTYRAEGTGLQG
jgi:hypothetical protein